MKKKPLVVKSYFTIEVLSEPFDVEISAEAGWENDGIGSYEWHGYKGNDPGTDYMVLKTNPTWDSSRLTPEQNQAMFSIPKETWTNIWDTLIEKAEREYESSLNG